MTFSGPKQLWWWVAVLIWIGVIAGVLGIVGSLVTIPVLSGSAFWLLAIGWLLLALAAAITYVRILGKPA